MSAPPHATDHPVTPPIFSLIRGKGVSDSNAIPGIGGESDLLTWIWTNSEDALEITDLQDDVVAVNDAYCRLFSTSSADVVGQKRRVLYPRTQAPRGSGLLPFKSLRTRVTGRGKRGVVPIGDGSVVPVELWETLFRTRDASLFCLTLYQRLDHRDTARESSPVNIDAKKQPEHENMYKAMISNAAQGFFQSTVDGQLLFANTALINMLGFTSFEELASGNLRDVYVNAADRTAMMSMLQEHGFCSGFELNLRRKDGTVITVLEHSRLVEDPTRNQVIIEGMLDDITSRKEAEMIIRQERNQLRTLIDNLPDLIYFKDVEGRYVLNNLAHLRTIGAASQNDVIGKFSRDFHPSQLAEQYHADEMTIINTAMPLLDKEELALHKDTGEHRWHLTNKFPLTDDRGTVTGLVGISRDITNQKEMEARMRENMCALQASREQLAQLNAQKDRLMSVLSHDLRSPFTSILGFCEILLSEAETLSASERSEFVTYIQRAAEQQLGLLNKLLDWSRLETGRIRLDVRDVDLTTITSNCVNAHLGVALKKSITLQSTLTSPMMTRADDTMLSQVFNNLLSNALKFTPAGGTISIEALPPDDNAWIIAVKDTGAGIPPEDLGKLFKVEEKYTRRGLRGEEGTGLGLSVVAEILKKHSGSVSVESKVGTGTTFTILLPRLRAGEGPKILVVDDDQGIRMLHSRFVKRMFPQGEILQAADGEEALDLAKKVHPHVVITDYSMPGMNGFDFLNRLKEIEHTRDIPVIVVTGKDSHDGKESLLLSGAAAVLIKPVSSKDLQSSIESVLAESSSGIAARPTTE